MLLYSWYFLVSEIITMFLSALINFISMKKWWLSEKTWESNSETNEREGRQAQTSGKYASRVLASFRHTKPGALCTLYAGGSVLMATDMQFWWIEYHSSPFPIPHRRNTRLSRYFLVWERNERENREIVKKYGIRRSRSSGRGTADDYANKFSRED